MSKLKRFVVIEIGCSNRFQEEVNNLLSMGYDLMSSLCFSHSSGDGSSVSGYRATMLLPIDLKIGSYEGLING